MAAQEVTTAAEATGDGAAEVGEPGVAGEGEALRSRASKTTNKRGRTCGETLMAAETTNAYSNILVTLMSSVEGKPISQKHIHAKRVVQSWDVVGLMISWRYPGEEGGASRASKKTVYLAGCEWRHQMSALWEEFRRLTPST